MSSFIDIVLFFYIMSLYFFTYLPELNIISNAIAAFFIFLVSLKMLIEKRKIIFNRFLFIYLCFIIICLVSYFYALNQSVALTMIKSLFLYFIFLFFFINYIDSYNKLINVLNYFIIAGVSAAIYLLVNTDFGNFQRVGELLGNINTIGIILSIPSLFCIFFILYQKKYQYLLPAMICMGIVLFTGSRAALVLLILGVLMLLYFNNEGSYEGKIKGILLSIILLFLFYFLLFEVPYFYQIAGYRVENIVKFFHAEKINEGSIIMRTFMVQFGFDLFKESPIFGYGINNYRIFLGREIGWMTYAHNNYIELLVGLGMIGTIVYYSIHASIILSLLKLRNKSSLRYLFLSFLLAMLIIDFASVNYYDKHIFIVFAMSSIFVNLRFLESDH